jgi:uncharacterized protein YqjF (DUF2071 family)
MHDILEETRHRPWPLPEAPWIMHQSWRDLLFMHWPVPYERLFPLVPHNLAIETHNGSGWIGITPLLMADVHVRGLPGVPTATEFPELNVRTYVRYKDKPGVLFFSLDAGSALAVMTARNLLNLPYYNAEMALARDEQNVIFASRRLEPPPADLVATYRCTGTGFHPKPGTLEHFLTERYCLYTVDANEHVSRIQIHHGPWLLNEAEVTLEKNTMDDYLGLVELSGPPRLAHYSARQDTLVWAPERVRPDDEEESV